MIIVEKDAHKQFLEHLEDIGSKGATSRCIKVTLPEEPLQNTVIYNVVEEVLPTVYHKNIYYVGEATFYITSNEMSLNDMKLITEKIQDALELDEQADFFFFYELPMQVNELIKVTAAEIEKFEIVLLDRQEQEKQERIDNILKLPVVSPQQIQSIKIKRQQPELMIIEDDPFSARLVKNAIGQDYSITHLLEATEALETYAQLSPDILFLDINLPHVTGLDLLKQIVTLDPKCYVIMLSGNSDKENIMNAISLGAKGFIGKPFAREKLYQYIDRCPTIQNS